MSPRKVRLVVNLIRGLDVKRAEIELAHLPKRAGGPLLKLLKSAVANAKNNFQIKEEHHLFIRMIRVDPGPTLYRRRPRAFGRASPIRKRTSHVSFILDTKEFVQPRKIKAKRAGPVIRDVTARDFYREKTEQSEEKRAVGDEKRIKTPDFVRRMFRRKAI